MLSQFNADEFARQTKSTMTDFRHNLRVQFLNELLSQEYINESDLEEFMAYEESRFAKERRDLVKENINEK